ncbi:MAG: hypothetical protein HQL31_02475 [Planctomycetes bacterium]|nr:hypothetical protein [Planctomycetota bacterium]
MKVSINKKWILFVLAVGLLAGCQQKEGREAQDSKNLDEIWREASAEGYAETLEQMQKTFDYKSGYGTQTNRFLVARGPRVARIFYHTAEIKKNDRPWFVVPGHEAFLVVDEGEIMVDKEMPEVTHHLGNLRTVSEITPADIRAAHEGETQARGRYSVPVVRETSKKR